MTDYAKINLDLIVSENSDYSNPYLHPKIAAFTATPAEVQWFLVQAHTTAVSVQLSTWTSIEYLILVNDAAVDVAYTYTTATNHVAAGASVRHDLKASRFNVVTDVDPSVALTLDSESSTTHRVYIGVVGT